MLHNFYYMCSPMAHEVMVMTSKRGLLVWKAWQNSTHKQLSNYNEKEFNSTHIIGPHSQKNIFFEKKNCYNVNFFHKLINPIDINNKLQQSCCILSLFNNFLLYCVERHWRCVALCSSVRNEEEVLKSSFLVYRNR